MLFVKSSPPFSPLELTSSTDLSLLSVYTSLPLSSSAWSTYPLSKSTLARTLLMRAVCSLGGSLFSWAWPLLVSLPNLQLSCSVPSLWFSSLRQLLSWICLSSACLSSCSLGFTDTVSPCPFTTVIVLFEQQVSPFLYFNISCDSNADSPSSYRSYLTPRTKSAKTWVSFSPGSSWTSLPYRLVHGSFEEKALISIKKKLVRTRWTAQVRLIPSVDWEFGLNRVVTTRAWW